MENILTAKWLSTTALSLSFSWIFTITQDLETAITALCILIMIDFLTWTIKSWIYRETSSDWVSRGFMRKCILIIVPFTLLITGKWVWIDLSVFITWVMWVLVFAECYSILWNICTITTGQKIPEYDAMTIIVKKISKIIDSFLVWK